MNDLFFLQNDDKIRRCRNDLKYCLLLFLFYFYCKDKIIIKIVSSHFFPPVLFARLKLVYDVNIYFNSGSNKFKNK